MSIAVVSVMMIAALNTLGASAKGARISGNAAIGSMLCAQLMSEILALPYEDPNETPVFGPEPTEASATRAAFDDVDDYNGWTTTDAQDRSGTPLPGRTGWGRSVTVEYVNPTTPSIPSVAGEGAKRITVSVTRNGRTMATLTAVVTESYQSSKS